MSVFRVKLTQGSGRDAQGALDSALVGGYSIQRNVYVMGPNKINRKLSDGSTFTDCNYWKRFAYPQVALNQAIVEVVSDDGSIYVDGENSTFPRVYDVSVGAGSVFADNVVDILTDNGGAASFTQIQNTGAQDVEVRINGLASAVLVIGNGSTQIFNNGDLDITKLEFADAGGGATTVVVTIAVMSVCRS